MKEKVHNYLVAVSILIFTLQTTGCGTILYPERRNQRATRVDMGVALLDGIWLLVGIVPGVIAFAVDFSTGAIYMPENDLVEGATPKYNVVRYDPEKMTKKDIETLISQEIGENFQFADGRYQMTQINNKNEWEQYLASRR